MNKIDNKKIRTVLTHFLKKIMAFLKDCIWNPLKYAITTIIFLIFVFVILDKILPKYQLYISIRDSIVEVAKNIHIVIKKDNALTLKIGHPDSQQGVRDDNYEINFPGENNFITIWFAIVNDKEDDIYKNVRLFISFTDNNRKIDGMDAGSGGWVKFKDNYFNYGTITEILQRFGTPTNPLKLKFPAEGIYKFDYTLYADGYKPTSGTKRIIVKK